MQKVKVTKTFHVREQGEWTTYQAGDIVSLDVDSLAETKKVNVEVLPEPVEVKVEAPLVSHSFIKLKKGKVKEEVLDGNFND